MCLLNPKIKLCGHKVCEDDRELSLQDKVQIYMFREEAIEEMTSEEVEGNIKAGIEVFGDDFEQFLDEYIGI